MGKLLLITGDLAAGKSTFARVLSNRYQIPVFCKDDVKETLGDTVGFSNREENLKLSVASAALMRLIFTEFSRLHRDLILESNFRQNELDLLYQMAGERGYDVMTVEIRGDLRVLHQRFLHRLYHEQRHPVHACGGFEDFDVFCAYVLGQRDISVLPPSVCLSADSFVYQQDPEILDRMDAFMLEERDS